MAAAVNEAYSVFAQVYDDFMEDVPYEQWADFLIGYLADKGVRDGLVLDLGCGSGEILSLLKEHGGFDMIGLDSSEEMLRIARDKEPDALYLCQDMREFELYGTVNAIVSVCDSINYIIEKDELLGLFKLANNYLEAGGYFIFDLNTVYKYKYELADNTFAEDREDKAFIWDNFFDEESGINEYLLTLFIGKDGVFRRYQEIHYERAYRLKEIAELLEAAGMEFVEAFAGYTKEKISPGDDENPQKGIDRMVIVAREKRQEGKLYVD